MKNIRENVIKFFIISALSTCLIYLSGCGGDEEVRSYTEKAPSTTKTAAKNPHANMANAGSPEMMKSAHSSKSSPLFAWETPEGWKETPSSSSMRIATFTAGDQKAGHAGTISCTIVPLKGTAGGMVANVQRWMGQLQLDIPEDQKLEAFIAKQRTFKTSANHPITLVDLTTIPADSDKHNVSMMVGIIVMKDTTMFVKMTGHRESLVKNRENLIALCRSIKIKE